MEEKRSRFHIILHHKYLITFIIFALIACFLDELSLYQKYKYRKEISRLKAGIAEYREQYAEDSLRLRKLERDPHEIKNIAREKYYMRSDNEDVYIIEE